MRSVELDTTVLTPSDWLQLALVGVLNFVFLTAGHVTVLGP